MQCFKQTLSSFPINVPLPHVPLHVVDSALAPNTSSWLAHHAARVHPVALYFISIMGEQRYRVTALKGNSNAHVEIMVPLDGRPHVSPAAVAVPSYS
jgi:hypothetical protein